MLKKNGKMDRRHKVPVIRIQQLDNEQENAPQPELTAQEKIDIEKKIKLRELESIALLNPVVYPQTIIESMPHDQSDVRDNSKSSEPKKSRRKSLLRTSTSPIFFQEKIALKQKVLKSKAMRVRRNHGPKKSRGQSPENPNFYDDMIPRRQRSGSHHVKNRDPELYEQLECKSPYVKQFDLTSKLETIGLNKVDHSEPLIQDQHMFD